MIPTAPEPRRRGRKALPPEQKKQRSLTFRLRDGQRARLQAIADATGRSLSEEVERRIELSFARPESFADFVAAFARFVETERANQPAPDAELADVDKVTVLSAVDVLARASGRRA